MPNDKESRKKKRLEETEYFIRMQTKIAAEENRNIHREPFIRLHDKVSNSSLPKHVQKKAQDVLERLETGTEMNYNFEKAYEYIQWLLKYPWNSIKPTNEPLITIEQKFKDLFWGREQVVHSILDYIALNKLDNGMQHGKNILFVGPPGTGKTYIAKKIAEALKFDFTAASFGGAADASWIKGIPRHYAGSQPGRIVRGMCETSHKNCVFILDELDKIGENTTHGSPLDALIDVIDPDNNHAFEDYYLETAVDLSKVLFIGIANNIDRIKPVLLDRFYIIQFEDYQPDEKQKICRNFTWKQILAKYGLHNYNIELKDEVLKYIINNDAYGMREIKRTLETICTHIARQIIMDRESDLKVQEKQYVVDISYLNSI